MKVSCHWISKLTFEGIADEHKVVMDAKSPLGNDAGASPKQLLLLAICGCSAMDVVSLLKKDKQPFENFEIEAVAEARKGHPAVFERIDLKYVITGEVDPQKANNAARLSMTQFCSVSAMIAKAAPIFYKVILNEQEIGDGKAEFSF